MAGTAHLAVANAVAAEVKQVQVCSLSSVVAAAPIDHDVTLGLQQSPLERLYFANSVKPERQTTKLFNTRQLTCQPGTKTRIVFVQCHPTRSS
jgi:hypothetical protein